MAGENQDIEQKIKLNYDTNAEAAAKEVNKLDGSIDKVNTSQTEAVKSNKKVEKSQKDATKSSKDQKKGLEEMPGPIGGVISGFKAMVKQMWAIVANPVGLVLIAIVGSLALLFKAFTSTKAGAEKFDQVMSGIGATIDVLRDRVLKVASAIGKFFSGDFKGAVATGREAVSGFGDEVKKEFEIAANATKSLQEVVDAMRGLGVARAKLDRDLAESERILTDVNATYAEKKKALEDVSTAEAKQTKQELANAEKKLKAIQDQNAQSDSSAEALDAEAEAQIAVFALQQKSSENLRKVADFNKTLAGEEESRRKTIADAASARAKVKADADAAEAKRIQDLATEKINTEAAATRAIQDLQDKTEEEKLARQKQRDLDELEAIKQKGINIEELLKLNSEKYNILEDELIEKRRLEKEEKDKKAKEDKLAADKKQAEEEAAIETAKLDQQKAIEDAKYDLLDQGLGALKNIFGKNKKIQKGILITENAVALSKLTMNTIEAVSKDNAASPLTLGMPWSGIHLATGAIGAANIIASTAQGLKALGGGSAGTAPNLGTVGGGGGASAAPSVAFQSSSENQIATSIADNTNAQPPVEAYVVSSSMTTAQALDRNKIESNSI